MTSVVMLAGYNRQKDVRKYAKVVAQHYGEHFVETGYKPLRNFEALQDGEVVRKPLIQFTLEQLALVDEISEVVIVGHRELLEIRLRDFLDDFKKSWLIIDQREPLPVELINRFHIRPRKVCAGTIAGNIVLGYAASSACTSHQPALFVGSDSPFTKRQFVEYFLRVANSLEGAYAIVVPAVLVDGDSDGFGRFPLKIINDSNFKASASLDSFGRQGFRASSLVYANPYGFDINMVNSAYSLRKGLSPSVQLKLFRITRHLGFPNIYTKYFIKKDLSLSEVESITSMFFAGKVKVIPVRDVESSYDYDGTDHELRKLREMLRSDNFSLFS